MNKPSSTLILLFAFIFASNMIACGEDETTDPACTAGDQACEGAQIKTCLDDGTWGAAEDCDAGKTCNEGHEGMDYVHCMDMNVDHDAMDHDAEDHDAMPMEDTGPVDDTTPEPPSACASYCDLALTTCTGDDALFDDNDACLAACEAYASNPAWDPDNPTWDDSLECRMGHLILAADDASECAAAGEDGGCVCVNKTVTATSDGMAYSFPSPFAGVYEGSESASYGGQIQRQVLIEDLKTYIGKLTENIDGGFSPAAAGDVVGELHYFFDFDADSDGGDEITLSTDPAPAQSTYGDLGSKNLKGKFAGNDASTDHEDWNTAFGGWTTANSATALLDSWFLTLENNAINHAEGGADRYGVDGYGVALTEPLPVHLTADGHDLQQLVQKFLSVAVNFSQGTDDYLDDGDGDSKGINVSNAQDGCKAYSKLMHHWDEGFGYYGAAKDNDAYLASEIAGKCTADDTVDPPVVCTRGKYYDTDDDGAIDLISEYNFGHSQNAAKRDNGATDATNMKGKVFDAFVAGRQLINAAGETLTAEEFADLQGHRDIIVLGWEEAIAATVVHYINDTLEDMSEFDTADYSFSDHAKHWGEMKGFAFGLQFNPRSPLSSDDFAAVHTAFGDAPVLPGADAAVIDAYTSSLVEAREILGTAYGFSTDNLAGW